MMKFEEARSKVLSQVAPVATEVLKLWECAGRVAGEDLVARFDLPSFDNTAMDGFAVRAEDCTTDQSLRVTHFLPAGSTGAGWTVEPGTAIRIMTGAPIPSGADAVIPLEETEFSETAVKPLATVKKGQHIRFAGEDVRQGEVIVGQGTPLRAAEIGILASMGLAQLKVFRRPKVAILATGDELIEAGEERTSGKVYNSNSVALAAAVKAAGAEPVLLGIARDNHVSLREKIAAGLQYDALITAAGVSVGDRDWVREILREMGVQEQFWRIQIKPGKSTAFGLYGSKPVFSVPGNPVSALLTFEELVRPALLRMLGHKRVIKPLLRARLAGRLGKVPGKIYFSRVCLRVVEGELVATSSGHQDTGFQKTLSRADGIAVLESERGSVNDGEMIKVHLLSGEIGLLEPND